MSGSSAGTRTALASLSPVGSQDSVVIIACLGLRVGVHQRGGQPWQRVQQAVLGLDRDLVCLDRAGTGVDDDLAFGAQLVPDPAQPDLAHAQHSWRRTQSPARLGRPERGRTASMSRR